MRSVVIADDHDSLRITVRRLLSEDPGIQVVGEASTGPEAVELGIRLRPGIIILDGHLPGLTGAEAAAKLSELVPETKCMVLSLSYGKAYVLRALQAGCLGYVAKQDAPECLATAINAVMRGECYLSPLVSAEFEYLKEATIQSEIWRETERHFAQEAASMYHLARMTGAATETTLEALRNSLLIYIVLASENKLGHRSFTTWMLVSMISMLFRKDSNPGSALRRTSKFRPRRWKSTHPTPVSFFAYWQRTLRFGGRQDLEDHLAWCRVCHLDWCLSGLTFLKPEDALTPMSSILAIPGIVADELRTLPAASILAHVVDHEARMRALSASERSIFLGRHFTGLDPSGSSQQQDARSLVGEFLGESAGLQAGAF